MSDPIFAIVERPADCPLFDMEYCAHPKRVTSHCFLQEGGCPLMGAPLVIRIGRSHELETPEHD